MSCRRRSRAAGAGPPPTTEPKGQRGLDRAAEKPERSAAVFYHSVRWQRLCLRTQSLSVRPPARPRARRVRVSPWCRSCGIEQRSVSRLRHRPAAISRHRGALRRRAGAARRGLFRTALFLSFLRPNALSYLYGELDIVHETAATVRRRRRRRRAVHEAATVIIDLRSVPDSCSISVLSFFRRAGFMSAEDR